MKKNRMQISTLLTLLLCMLLLTACGASAAESEGTDPETPPQESAAAPETEEPSAQQEDVTLEELLGEDYVNYLTETITMQMANRMDKDPEVRYFPIEDNTPLSDYVTIGGTTKFEVDEEGNPVIYFPAGTVTDEANGEQSFRIPKHTVLAKRNLLCSTFAGNHANYKKECRKDTGGNGLIRLAGAFPQKTRTYRLLSFFLPLFPAPNRVSEIPQTTH